MLRKKIISCFLVFVTCLSLFPVAHAEYISKNSNFWERLMHDAIKGTEDIPILAQGVQGVASKLEGDICSISDDGYHYGDTLVAISDKQDDNGRSVALSVCKFCNKQFHCYVSDLSTAYDTYVTDLPAGSITSDNSLVYYLERTTNKITTDYYTSAIWVDNEHFVVERRDNSRPNFALNFFYEGISPVSGTYVFDKNFSCVVKSSEGILYSNYIYDIWKDGLYSSGT